MKRKRREDSEITPVRNALVAESTLRTRVADGLAAMESAHRSYIEESLRAEFTDSLDLDEAMRAGHEQENLWDYLLGHAPSTAVVGLEPHTAKGDAISAVIAKRKAAKDQLRPHLRPNSRIGAWLWVASGGVQFADTEKARRRLDQSGIQFVGKKVLRKHLPAGA
jgi:hypothetical protein